MLYNKIQAFPELNPVHTFADLQFFLHTIFSKSALYPQTGRNAAGCDNGCKEKQCFPLHPHCNQNLYIYPRYICLLQRHLFYNDCVTTYTGISPNLAIDFSIPFDYSMAKFNDKLRSLLENQA